MRSFPERPALTILTFAVLLVFAGWVRKDLHGLSPELFSAIVDFRPSQLPADLAPEPVRPSRFVPTSYLEDNAGSLDHFYQALWRTEKKEPGAITRILHYGDSPTTADLITGDARALLQARYGDSGHGFTLIAKPWAWYEHWGVKLSASGWDIHPATQPDLKDGMYGLGGVAFLSPGGAHSRILLRDRTHTQLEVSYLRQPGGGEIAVSTGDAAIGRIETAGDAKRPGFATFELHPPIGEIDLRAEGMVRVFGVALEKTSPGVVYDSLGMNGAFTTVLARIFNERQWTEQLRRRKPDLVIVNYGTNESGFGAYIGKWYESELRLAIARLHAALPGCSLLIMSPIDRGERVAGGEIRTMATIPRIVGIQQRVARETGCGFFNAFEAAGGAGTMARWYEARPRLVSADFIHTTPAGARQVGELLFRRLCQGLNEYKYRQLSGRVVVARRK
jgi:lysophospholipase L1-like esterase